MRIKLFQNFWLSGPAISNGHGKLSAAATPGRMPGAVTNSADFVFDEGDVFYKWMQDCEAKDGD